jgi:hypothetical protein
VDYSILTNNAIAIISIILAISTAFVGLAQYRLQGKQKRAEFFIELRLKLKKNSIFKNICALIETDSPELEDVAFAEKRDFLGFFEEVALMMNSGLIKKEVAHYMFGYYAINCWDSKNFWGDVNRDSPYWSVFRNFVKQMKEIESSANFLTDNMKYQKKMNFSSELLI